MWRQVTIGEEFHTVTGSTPPKNNPDNYGDYISLVKPPELLNAEIGDTSDNLSKTGALNARLLVKGAVLVSCIGNLGKVGLATRQLSCNQQINAIIPNEKTDSRFLFYLALSPWFQSQLHTLASGTTVQIVNKSRFNSIKACIPPLDEQKRIVAILDQAFEGIDKAIANTEQNLINARELFESVLQQAFTKHKADAPSRSLAEIATNLDKKRVPITKSKREAGDVPYYGASGVVDYVRDYIFDGDYLLVSEDGANLLARTYPIAFSISGKSWVNNHAHILEFQSQVTQKYAELYLNSISLVPFVSGMAQPKLNQKKLNTIPIPVPSAEDQRQLVNKMDRIGRDVRTLAKQNGTKLTALKELKQSLLQKAFSGELTGATAQEAAKVA